MKLDFISQPSSKSLLQDYSKCNNARLISTQFLLPCFDPNEWCMKNGLHSGGLNPRPVLVSFAITVAFVVVVLTITVAFVVVVLVIFVANVVVVVFVVANTVVALVIVVTFVFDVLAIIAATAVFFCFGYCCSNC